MDILRDGVVRKLLIPIKLTKLILFCMQFLVKLLLCQLGE